MKKYSLKPFGGYEPVIRSYDPDAQFILKPCFLIGILGVVYELWRIWLSINVYEVWGMSAVKSCVACMKRRHVGL